MLPMYQVLPSDLFLGVLSYLFWPKWPPFGWLFDDARAGRERRMVSFMTALVTAHDFWSANTSGKLKFPFLLLQLTPPPVLALSWTSWAKQGHSSMTTEETIAQQRPNWTACSFRDSGLKHPNWPPPHEWLLAYVWYWPLKAQMAWLRHTCGRQM